MNELKRDGVTYRRVVKIGKENPFSGPSEHVWVNVEGNLAADQNGLEYSYRYRAQDTIPVPVKKKWWVLW